MGYMLGYIEAGYFNVLIEQIEFTVNTFSHYKIFTKRL